MVAQGYYFDALVEGKGVGGQREERTLQIQSGDGVGVVMQRRPR